MYIQVLTSWLEYTARRKHKRARVMHALDVRRTNLLRSGVVKFLEVAADLASIRQRCAAEHGAEVSSQKYLAGVQ